MRVVEASGNSAKGRRGERVDDDDMKLPSERIKAGAEAADAQVLSSGDAAREKRRKKNRVGKGVEPDALKIRLWVSSLSSDTSVC